MWRMMHARRQTQHSVLPSINHSGKFVCALAPPYQHTVILEPLQASTLTAAWIDTRVWQQMQSQQMI